MEVAVTPRRLGAPDIESVRVSRDGRVVAPLKTSLRPMTFSNGAGVESVLHAGEVQFSPAAFLPRRRRRVDTHAARPGSHRVHLHRFGTRHAALVTADRSRRAARQGRASATRMAPHDSDQCFGGGSRRLATRRALFRIARVALVTVSVAREMASTSPPTRNGSRTLLPANCAANAGVSTEKYP